jgi:Peptidase_C39 like family
MAVLYNRLVRPSPEVIKRVAEEMRGMPWTARVFTNFDQMRNLARRRGVPFRNIYRWDEVFASLDAGQPVVVLIDNTVPVPRQYPTGPGWAAAHFIVLTGYDETNFFVNDPLNQGWHGVPVGPAHYTGASVRRACAAVSAQQNLGVEVMAIAIDRLPQPEVPRQDGGDSVGALGGVDPNEFPPEFALTDEQLASYLSQLGTPVNMETAIIRRACLAYRHGETRGPAVSGEYPAQAPDGRQVIRQNFTAGIAEYDPQTGAVGWVELVARPDALRSG